MTLIADNASLAEFCARQASAPYITVDTEFLRDTTFWPKLCLVQIGGPDEVAAIDSLVEGLDLKPLYDLLSNLRVLKIFHSARQDMEIFYQCMGHLPLPIFDTQVAAMVCGFGDSVGYDTLARKLLGTRIDKSSRFADWSRRPLTERQLSYALSDVTHLREIYEILQARLEKTGRSSWLAEEMAVLTTPETYDLDPRLAWRRIKLRSTDPRFLAVVREVTAWREQEAQRRNVPRNRVLRDEQLLDISAHRPVTPEAMARTRGLSRDVANGRIGRALIDAVKTGLEVPQEDCPVMPPKPELPSGLGPVIDLLKVLLKMKCEEHEVAQKLVASVADLEMIAADDNAPVAALSGWRREVFGADALALKHGQVALGTQGNRVEVVHLEQSRKESA